MLTRLLISSYQNIANLRDKEGGNRDTPPYCTLQSTGIIHPFSSRSWLKPPNSPDFFVIIIVTIVIIIVVVISRDPNHLHSGDTSIEVFRYH